MSKEKCPLRSLEADGDPKFVFVGRGNYCAAAPFRFLNLIINRIIVLQILNLIMIHLN